MIRLNEGKKDAIRTLSKMGYNDTQIQRRLDYFLEIDPTKNGKYLEVLASFGDGYDIESLKDKIIQAENRNISIDLHQYRGEYFDFVEALDKFNKRVSKSQYKKMSLSGLREGLDYLDHSTDDYFVLTPLNWETSKAIASKRFGGVVGEWCTAYQKSAYYWNDKIFEEDSILTYVIAKEMDEELFFKMAIDHRGHLAEGEFWSAEDDSLSYGDAKRVIGLFPDTFIQVIEVDKRLYGEAPSSAKMYCDRYAIDGDTDPYPYLDVSEIDYLELTEFMNEVESTNDEAYSRLFEQLDYSEMSVQLYTYEIVNYEVTPTVYAVIQSDQASTGLLEPILEDMYDRKTLTQALTIFTKHTNSVSTLEGLEESLYRLSDDYFKDLSGMEDFIEGVLDMTMSDFSHHIARSHFSMKTFEDMITDTYKITGAEEDLWDRIYKMGNRPEREIVTFIAGRLMND